MNHRFSSWPIFAALLGITGMLSCTKIDTTKVGAGLILPVDNINTFETILPVVANNYIVNDSTRLFRSDYHVVGSINDPVFGSTSSTIFFELKPTAFPFKPVANDSLIGTNVGFDSAVLSVPYVGSYGDSSSLITFKLYEVNKKMHHDSLRRPIYDIYATSSEGKLSINKAKLWGEKTISPIQFKDSFLIKGSTAAGNITVVNQLRIPLNTSLAKQLFLQDTSATGAFYNDSAFKNYLSGFALTAEMGTGALMYFNLSSAKIDFFYRSKPLSPTQDTGIASITFNPACGHAIDFVRERTKAEVNKLAGQVNNWNNGYDKIFIQSTPGTAARIRVKGLDTVANINRIVHKAELRVTQLRMPSSSQSLPPAALYLDINYDSTKNSYKGMPLDLSPFSSYYCYPSTEVYLPYFGGLTRYEKLAGSQDSTAVYRFNITRYIQSIITKGETLYEFRLSAPFYNFYESCVSTNSNYPQNVFPYTYGGVMLNPIGRGQIVVAGGNASVDQAVRMQLSIIYSKL